MRVLLANPRGFCAGVDRAISIVECALEMYGAPIYVRHEVVHNRYVVETLAKRGIIFIEKISEVPDRSMLIFSAHGVSKSVRSEAYSRDLMVLDATCPLVKKVHMEVSRASSKGKEVILIGHAHHPEVEGTIGQYNSPSGLGGIYLIESEEDVWKLQVNNANNLCFVTQTTLSLNDTSDIIHALRQRFPNIVGPHKSDICYATINRQEAIRNLSANVDIVLVVGSRNSSNSNRLAELAKRFGKSSYLIDGVDDIQKTWLQDIHTVGVTAGASAPNILVRQVIDYLQKLGASSVEELIGQEENMIFELPKELGQFSSSSSRSEEQSFFLYDGEFCNRDLL